MVDVALVVSFFILKIFCAKLLLSNLGNNRMIEYIVLIPSLLKVDNDEIAQEEPTFSEVARYNFDLGLQLDDKIAIRDITYGDKIFSFTGAVVDVLKVIKQNKEKVHKNDNDIFRIEVTIEIDDKEDMVEIRDIAKGLNPGKFKD